MSKASLQNFLYGVIGTNPYAPITRRTATTTTTGAPATNATTNGIITTTTEDRSGLTEEGSGSIEIGSEDGDGEPGNNAN